MKKIKLLGLAVMLFVSACNTKPEQIVDSKVVSSGMGTVTQSTVEDEVSKTNSVVLNYESWADLDVTTKAAQSRRVKANICAELRAYSGVRISDRIYFIDDTPTLECKYERIEKETKVDDYITLVDSVFVCQVAIENDDRVVYYSLTYQVPFYDDGITRFEMPHHRIEFVGASDVTYDQNNSYQIDPADQNIVFAVRTMHHSIKVKFADKVYEVPSVVKLKKVVALDGKLPVVIQTDKIDAGLGEIASSNSVGGSDLRYESWVKVRHTLSDGTTKEETFTEEISDFYCFDQNSHQFKIVPNLDLTFADLDLTKHEQDEYLRPGRTQNIEIRGVKDQYTIAGNHFSLRFDVDKSVPCFENGLTLIEMPHVAVEGFKFSFDIADNVRDEIIDGEIPVWGYDFNPKVSWKYEGKDYYCDDLISLYKYK